MVILGLNCHFRYVYFTIIKEHIIKLANTLHSQRCANTTSCGHLPQNRPSIAQNQGKQNLPTLTDCLAGWECFLHQELGKMGAATWNIYLEIHWNCSSTTQGCGVRRAFPCQLPHSAAPYWAGAWGGGTASLPGHGARIRLLHGARGIAVVPCLSRPLEWCSTTWIWVGGVSAAMPSIIPTEFP